MPPGQQLEHGDVLVHVQYARPLYVQLQFAPTQVEPHTCPPLSVHCASQVGGAPPPVPPVPPEAPPEQTIPEGGNGALPAHWVGIGWAGVGGGAGSGTGAMPTGVMACSMHRDISARCVSHPKKVAPPLGMQPIFAFAKHTSAASNSGAHCGN
jgi:hypothetical protein